MEFIAKLLKRSTLEVFSKSLDFALNDKETFEARLRWTKDDDALLSFCVLHYGRKW